MRTPAYTPTSANASIVTILAFVYVPLNLATSVFGMNLQQLNGSGKSMKAFLLTAIVALVITVTVWWLMEEGRHYRIWRTRIAGMDGNDTDTYSKTAACTVLLRIRMLTWIIGNRLFMSMLHTGAVFCLIRKPSARFCCSPCDCDTNYNSNWPYRQYRPDHREEIFAYITRLMGYSRLHRKSDDLVLEENLLDAARDRTREGYWPCWERVLLRKWGIHGDKSKRITASKKFMNRA